MLLPECLEVQFGWVQRHFYPEGYATLSGSMGPTMDAARIRLVTSGQIDVTVGTAHYLQEQGEVMLLPPLKTPEMRGVQGITDSLFFAVGFKLLLFGSIDVTPLLKYALWRPEAETFDVLAGLCRVLHHPTQVTMAASMVRDGAIRTIVGLCWDAINMEEMVEGLHPHVPRWLSLVIQEMRHYPNMNVTELAQVAGYGLTRFNKLFQQYVGMAPRVYLQRNRVELAKHLLATTDMSVAAIATHLGFTNASDFARFFRRMCFVPPSEYRQTAVMTESDLLI